MNLKNINVVEAQIQAHLKRQDKVEKLRYTGINAFTSQLEFKASNSLKRLKNYFAVLELG